MLTSLGNQKKLTWFQWSCLKDQILLFTRCPTTFIPHPFRKIRVFRATLILPNPFRKIRVFQLSSWLQALAWWDLICQNMIKKKWQILFTSPVWLISTSSVTFNQFKTVNSRRCKIKRRVNTLSLPSSYLSILCARGSLSRVASANCGMILSST